MSFVSFTEFQVRYENTIPAADEERVAAYLEDACALVSDIVGATAAAAWDEDGSGSAAPGGIVAVVYAAVRRAYENPGGLQGETIGDYSWRGAGSQSTGVYFEPAEVRQIRRAAGLSAVGTIELQGMLPDTLGASQYLTVTDGGAPVLYFDGDDVA